MRKKKKLYKIKILITLRIKVQRRSHFFSFLSFSSHSIMHRNFKFQTILHPANGERTLITASVAQRYMLQHKIRVQLFLN